MSVRALLANSGAISSSYPSCGPPDPGDDGELERKPNIKRQRASDIGVERGVLCHLKVGREYGDQKCDQADAGESSSPWNQYAHPAEALANAADRNEQNVIRQVARHDAEIESWVYEVIGAR